MIGVLAPKVEHDLEQDGVGMQSKRVYSGLGLGLGLVDFSVHAS